MSENERLSARLVESIIRNIPGGLAEFRCEKGKPVRTYLSEDAYKILGYSDSDRPASDLASAFSRVNPEDRKAALETIGDAIKNVSTIDIKMRVNPVGKGTRWISFVAYPNKDLDGTVYFYGIYADITKQKAREEARRLSLAGMGERRRSGREDVLTGAWRELFIQSEEMLFIKNIDLIYLAASKPFAEMVGIADPDEIIGKTDFDIFADQDLARRYTQDDMRVIQSGLNMESFIEPLTERDGRRRYSSTSKYAVRDEDGRIVGILGRGRDITPSLQNPADEGAAGAIKTLFRYVVKGRRMEMPPKATVDYGVPSSVDEGPEYFVSEGFIAPESKDAWLGFFMRVDSGDRSGEVDVKTVKASGEAAWLRLQFTLVTGENGEAAFAIVSYEDITRRRASDKSLSVEYMGFYGAMRTVYTLSLAVNLTQNSYYMVDNERYIRKSREDKGVFDNLIKAGVDSLPDEDKEAFYAAFSRESLLKAFADGKNIVSLEHRQYADDGMIHWVETTVLRIDNPYDDDVLEFTLSRIIDDKKANEEKLKKALEMTTGELSEKLRFIQLVDDIFPGLIFVYYPATDEVDSLTGNLCGIFGYTCREIMRFIRARFSGIPHQEDADDIVSAIEQIEKTAPESFEYELRAHAKNGELRYVTIRGKRIAANGEKDGYICFIVDTTSRRVLTDGLRMSGEEIKLCMARMGKLILRYDARTKTFILPGEYAAAVGLEEECRDIVASLKEKGFSLAENKDNREAFEDFARDMYSGARTGECEIALNQPNGDKRWMKLEFVGIFDESDRFARAVISAEDVTVKRAYAEENKKLRENENIMRALADNSDRAAYYYDIASRAASSINDPAAKALGLPLQIADPPERQIAAGVIAPESVKSCREMLREINAGTEKGEAKIRVRLGGSWRWLEARYTAMNEPGRRPAGTIVTMLDITKRHELELTYARYLQNMTSNGEQEVLFFETDLTRDMIEQQGGVFSPFHMMGEGLSHTDVANYIAENYFDEASRAAAIEYMDKDRLLGLFASGVAETANDWEVVFDDGETHWVRSNMQMVTDPYTGHVRLLTVIKDVTDEKLKDLSLHKQAKLDGLTGLLNRATAEATIREKLKGAKECALVVFDVDDLKRINDTRGHAQGDEALCTVAREIARCAGEDDVLGRLGGDEFVAFIPAASEEAVREKLRMFLNGLKERGQEIRCSAGAAMGKGESDTFETLYKKADETLYKVKRGGKNAFSLWQQ